MTPSPPFNSRLILIFMSAAISMSAIAARGDAAEEPEPEGTQAGAGKTAGTPVIVFQAGSFCFSDAVRVTGFLAPRADAVVTLTLDNYQVADVLAADNDVVAEGQALARLARIGAEPGRPGQASAAAALPASIVLRAPAAGKIIQSTAIAGAVSSSRGEPLFRLAIDGLIEVDAEVSSIYLSEIKPEQSARVEIEPGREVDGRVRKVAAQVDPVTQMGHVRIAIDRDAAERPGRFVRATINARQSCGVAVPRSAVLYTKDGTSVQVVRGHHIETLRVRVGLRSDHDAEIKEGLRVGELVVAHAGGSLRDGDQVSPVFSDDPAQRLERP
ncbi:efflux RND transporter periplasmic adaptor subunit [Methylocapsa palsarum]|uniref:RND family efflux transporter, MFP subunit n=1 Tax=Methylocapsa palsarum TaxID=1612308 RepID=A0A1I4CDH0_9HYPH|nr:efflux RND transporter periplasmic adaptor subunit [Methylocapsa palsarum]SFK78206.1 RND family efflux transporter, MFP subunit [Methylocapsa palsarum]